jgi:proteasome accessory factor C
MADAKDRIQRLLLLLSYVRRHQGATVAQVAEAVGLSVDELKRTIPELSLCGKPPFNPGDLIDVFIDSQERVHVDFDQALGRPLRLTQEESLALAVALRALAASHAGDWSDTARSLLDKLKGLLGGRTEELERRFALESEDRFYEERFRALQRGFEEHRAVEIVYYTAERGEVSRRRVNPYGLVQFLGAWYVVGHDDRRQEIRIFKVERIGEAQLTDAVFDPPDDFDVQKYARAHLSPSASGSPLKDRRARIRFAPSLARVIAEDQDPARVTAEPDGSVVLSLEFAQPAWAAAWALAYGPDAQVLEPADVRLALAARIRETLALY